MSAMSRCLLFLLAGSISFHAQARPQGGQPSNLKNTVFTFNKALTEQYWTHPFAPAAGDITVYSNTGEKLTMKKGHSYGVGRMVNGTYAGYTGLWLEFYDLKGQKHDNYRTYYARFDQLQDLQPQFDAQYAKDLVATQKYRREKNWEMAKGIGLWVLCVAVAVIVIVPLGLYLGWDFRPTGTGGGFSSVQFFDEKGSVRSGESDGMGRVKETGTGRVYKQTGAATYKRES